MGEWRGFWALRPDSSNEKFARDVIEKIDDLIECAFTLSR